MSKLFLLTFFLLTFSALYSQTDNQDYFSYITDDAQTGKIKINQDEEIAVIIKKHIEVGEKLKAIPGFRIRIYSDSGHTARDNANKTKAVFLKLFPDVESYLKYDQPNWKVLVGDFRTKSDALKFIKLISEDFPSAFIVKDMINFPKIN